MPPERAPAVPFDLERLDFTRRAAPHELPEWMDEPCTYEQFRACLRDLGQANRTTLGYRPTLRFLQHVASLRTSVAANQPLRIVDVGSGGGDTLRVIERWARRRQLSVTLTGVDLNPYAARAAREFSPASSQIRWVTANALSFSQTGGIDVVISSLCMHHLEDEEIVRFLAWAEGVTRVGWFLNDLRRSRAYFMLFRALARTARWHSFVRHDGPVSIRRSFREDDWKRLLTDAGVAVSSCTIERFLPGRLCVERLKEPAQ